MGFPMVLPSSSSAVEFIAIAMSSSPLSCLTIISPTCILFSVSVPVLSVHITVTAPMVSQACSFLTRLFDFNILLMFKARASVTAIGSPSGTAMTISVTAIMKYFSTTSAIFRYSDVDHSGLVRMSCPRNPTKASTDTADPTLLMSLASRSSWRLRGVFTAVSSVAFVATLPISVASPTDVTLIFPEPFITIVDRSARFEGYVAPSCFTSTNFEIIGSPVSVDSSICKSTASNSIPSAGTSSPTPSTTMSSTTISRRGTSTT